MVLSLLGGHLPAFKESISECFYWDKEVYNPQIVLSQFGLVQDVPLASPSMSFREINYRDLNPNIRKHSYYVERLRPCRASW